MKSKNGLTITELLIVVSILALIFCIIFISVSRARELARRAQCARQLRSLSHAIHMYQGDWGGQNPFLWSSKVKNNQFGTGLYNAPGGTKNTRWANPNFSDWDNQPTVGGCLYLLVKYEQAHPREFICPGAPDDREMEWGDAVNVAVRNGWSVGDWDDLSDFQSMRNLSYSYQDPWRFPTKAYSHPSIALLADKSNAYDTATGVRNVSAGDFPVQNKDGSWDDDKGKNQQHGNSPNHQTECLNVLFVGTNVDRVTRPTVGIRGDNIYTYWSGGPESSKAQMETGLWDGGHPVYRSESYLGN